MKTPNKIIIPTITLISKICLVLLIASHIGYSQECTVESNLQVTIIAKPVAVFDFTVNDFEVSFQNLSENGTTYEWNFGDNIGFSNEPNPSYFYSNSGNYLVTLSLLNECGSSTYSDSILIVCPERNISIETSSPNIICADEVFEMQVESGFNSYQWFHNDIPIPNVGSNAIEVTEPGDYYVLLTDINSCTAKSNVVGLTVNPLPLADFDIEQNDFTIDLINNSNNATSISWDFGDGSPISSDINPTHIYLQTGTYTITLLASNECGDDTITQTISIDCPELMLNINSEDSLSICENQFIDLSATQGFTEYEWFLNGDSFYNGPESNIQVGIQGDYQVLGTDSQGCEVLSQSINLKVTSLVIPSFDFVISDFTVDFINTSLYADTYSWSFGDGSSDITDSNPSHQFEFPGSYLVVLSGTNECGTFSSSQEITITCPDLSIEIISIGDNQICEGDTIEMHLDNEQFISYEWYKDSELIPNENDSILLTMQEGNYSVITQDKHNCSYVSNEVSLIVNQLPNAQIESNNSGSVCAGDSIVLIGSIAETYNWLLPNNSISNQSSLEINPASVDQSGIYHLTITDANLCCNHTSYELIINPLPEVELDGLNQSYMTNDQAIPLIGIPAGGTFSGPGVIGGSFDPSIAGSGDHLILYYFTDENACSNFDSIRVEVLLSSSIVELDNINSLSLYPNPSSGNFHISAISDIAKVLKLSIYSVIGEEIYNTTWNLKKGNTIKQLESKDWPAGLYFIIITDGNKKTTMPLILSK